MTRRFERMCEVYKVFSKSWDCDFSKEAQQAMYDYETFGKGIINNGIFTIGGEKPNGYAVGKKWLNVSIELWFESMRTNGWAYQLNELNKDKEIPRWYIEGFFINFYKEKKKEYIELGMSKNIMDMFEKRFKEVTTKGMI